MPSNGFSRVVFFFVVLYWWKALHHSMVWQRRWQNITHSARSEFSSSFFIKVIIIMWNDLFWFICVCARRALLLYFANSFPVVLWCVMLQCCTLVLFCMKWKFVEHFSNVLGVEKKKYDTKWILVLILVMIFFLLAPHFVEWNLLKLIDSSPYCFFCVL